MPQKNQARKAQADLNKEVKKLAQQVLAVIKDPVVQGEVKGIGREALRGMRATGGRIAQALRKAQQSERAHQIKSQARKVYGAGKREGGKTAKVVSANLVKRLQHLGDELRKVSQHLRQKSR
jgi:hypothetical protein